MKEKEKVYLLPDITLMQLESNDFIATSGDIDNYNNEDYNWGN